MVTIKLIDTYTTHGPISTINEGITPHFVTTYPRFKFTCFLVFSVVLSCTKWSVNFSWTFDLHLAYAALCRLRTIRGNSTLHIIPTFSLLVRKLVPLLRVVIRHKIWITQIYLRNFSFPHIPWVYHTLVHSLAWPLLSVHGQIVRNVQVPRRGTRTTAPAS